MSEEKLKIKPRLFSGKTTAVSMRLPTDMLTIIDRVAKNTGRSRNEIMIMSMEYAIENMEVGNKWGALS